MDNKPTQEEYYRGLSAKLLTSLTKAKHHLKIHKPSLGAYGEFLLKNTLRKIIPSEYAICQGFVVGNKADISNQCDIIIYKKDHAIMHSFGDTKFVNSNSVVAVLEVKSSVNEQTFHTTLRACERLKNLGVTFTTMFVYGKLTKNCITRWLTSYKNIGIEDDPIATNTYLYDWPDIQWLPNFILSLDGNCLYSLAISPYKNGDWMGYSSYNIIDNENKQISCIQELFNEICIVLSDYNNNINYNINIDKYSIQNGIRLFHI